MTADCRSGCKVHKFFCYYKIFLVIFPKYFNNYPPFTTKIIKSFLFLWNFTHFFVPLTCLSKVLSLENAKENENNFLFLWNFTHFFVPLQPECPVSRCLILT